MTLYLTDATTPEEIAKAAASTFVYACKLYPAGATTNSASGVTDLAHLTPVFEAMEEHSLPLLIHGEVTDSDIDIFDREMVFIERHLEPILKRHPKLRIVLEHITTKNAVEFIKSAPATVAATITPQHLLYNRNDMLVGGIRPHLYCLPILKAQLHQRALQEAAVSKSPKFFLGTDSAPHPRSMKETDCGCAGCYSAPVAIELYATIFDRLGALDALEAFASHYGPDFYQLARNTTKLRLKRCSNRVPDRLKFIGDDGIVPLAAGAELDWELV